MTGCARMDSEARGDLFQSHGRLAMQEEIPIWCQVSHRGQEEAAWGASSGFGSSGSPVATAITVGGGVGVRTWSP